MEENNEIQEIERQHSVKKQYRDLINELVESGESEQSLKQYFKKMRENGSLNRIDYELIYNLISSRFKYIKKGEEIERAKKLFNVDFKGDLKEDE